MSLTKVKKMSKGWGKEEKRSEEKVININFNLSFRNFHFILHLFQENQRQFLRVIFERYIFSPLVLLLRLLFWKILRKQRPILSMNVAMMHELPLTIKRNISFHCFHFLLHNSNFSHIFFSASLRFVHFFSSFDNWEYCRNWNACQLHKRFIQFWEVGKDEKCVRSRHFHTNFVVDKRHCYCRAKGGKET